MNCIHKPVVSPYAAPIYIHTKFSKKTLKKEVHPCPLPRVKLSCNPFSLILNPASRPTHSITHIMLFEPSAPGPHEHQQQYVSAVDVMKGNIHFIRCRLSINLQMCLRDRHCVAYIQNSV